MSLKEIMASLCNGLTLVFAGDDSAHNPTRLADLFDKTKADAFNTTPSVMLEYMNYPLFLDALLKSSVIMAGGEKYPNVLRVKLLENISENLGSETILLNTYGPTEITVSSNAKLIDENSLITVGPPLYGYFEHVIKNQVYSKGIYQKAWEMDRDIAFQKQMSGYQDGYLEKKNFTTDYSYDKRNISHGRYVEDFAESVMEYMNPKTHDVFVMKFLNKAKAIENIIFYLI
jgi:acyl-coenzyme A synthetase/AMP-(fatty) acid ligase